MRIINYIVLHCTGGPQTQTVEAIQAYWRDALGWKKPGYHFILKTNGEVINLLPITEIANGVAGYNANSIHISYIGGANGHDSRTAEQKAAQAKLVKKLKLQFPQAEIKGHRDFPGVKKACPAFDVKKWLKTI